MINITSIFKGRGHNLKMALVKNQKKAAIAAVLFFLVSITLVFINDSIEAMALCTGLALIIFLTATTFLVLLKMGITDRRAFVLFLITLFIHLASALLLYYVIYHTPIRPLGGGGDYDLYQNNAMQVAERFEAGNFSLKGLYTEHYFSVIIGVLYMITLPHVIIGQLFTVWLGAFSALLVYFLVLEIGGSKQWAFLIGLATSLYPSYVFFGSVLLKEIFIIPLILLGMLLFVQMSKSFSGVKFVAIFLIVTSVIHFRFYIGLALMFSFIVSWFFTSNLKVGERTTLGLAMAFLLGFAPSLMGYGYLGEVPFNIYVNKQQIKNLREVVYAPISEGSPSSAIALKTESPDVQTNSRGQVKPPVDFFTERQKAVQEYETAEGRTTVEQEIIGKLDENPSFTPAEKVAIEIKISEGRHLTGQEIAKGLQIDSSAQASKSKMNASSKASTQPVATREEIRGAGVGSSFDLRSGVEDNNKFTFIKNYILSFIYTLFGPFWWQLRLKRQFIALFEMIPWWLICGVILYNIWASIKNNGLRGFLATHKYVLPLVLFSIISAGAISLFINNFGIIARIRMPVFICLLCIVSSGPYFFENGLRFFKK